MYHRSFFHVDLPLSWLLKNRDAEFSDSERGFPHATDQLITQFSSLIFALRLEHRRELGVLTVDCLQPWMVAGNRYWF